MIILTLFLTQVNKKKFKINLKVFFEYLQAGVATGEGWGQESGEENERGGGWVREGSGAWEEKWFVGWVCDKVSVAELVRFWTALVFVCRLRVNYYLFFKIDINQCCNKQRESEYRYHSEFILFHLRWSRKLEPLHSNQLWLWINVPVPAPQHWTR